MRTRLPLLPALVLALALLVGACSNPAQPDLTQDRPTTIAADEVEAAQPPAETTLIARVDHDIAALAAPDPNAEVVATFGPTTEFGSERTFLVVGSDSGWVELSLPIRPNGTTGHVPADQVDLVESRHEIIVNRTDRTLTVFEAGDAVMETPIAIGTPDAPTPQGQLFITDLLVTGDPGSAYGPYAFGLSGFSETLSEFAGGNGQIGIHGTNDPSSIGQAASHGCVRVPNDVVDSLARELPLGTPVRIV